MDPVTVRIDSQPVTVTPEGIGLHFDAAATVDRAAAGWPNPFHVITGREVEPVITVDSGRMEAALAKPAAKVGRAAKPATVTFDGLRPKPTYAVAGRVLDQDRAVAALRAGWLRTADIAVPMKEQRPEATNAEVDRLVRELAVPAVAAPVSVDTPKGDLTIQPTDIAKSLVIASDTNGEVTARVDETKLRSALREDLAAIEIEPPERRHRADGERPAEDPRQHRRHARRHREAQP